MPTDRAPPGVTPIDHTADVGLEVEAVDLQELFVRAGRGMAWLIRGGDRPEDERSSAGAGDRTGVEPRSRRLELSASDVATLLRAWLRELLLWHEIEGLSLAAASFDTLSERRLDATMHLIADTHVPIREIKGVTLHELVAERRGDVWLARVIFDV